jgi:hypothetical protein
MSWLLIFASQFQRCCVVQTMFSHKMLTRVAVHSYVQIGITDLFLLWKTLEIYKIKLIPTFYEFMGYLNADHSGREI